MGAFVDGVFPFIRDATFFQAHFPLIYKSVFRLKTYGGTKLSYKKKSHIRSTLVTMFPQVEDNVGALN